VCLGSGCIVKMGFSVGFESMECCFSGIDHGRAGVCVVILLYCSISIVC
jgi:hypothetical protein